MHFITLALSLLSLTGVAPAPGSVQGPTFTVHSLNSSTNGAKPEKRALIDLSGYPCTSSCSGTAGQGPNENDCLVLINEYWSMGDQKIRPSTPPHSVQVSAQTSCEIDIVNPTDNEIQYQYNDLGTVADWLRTQCNAAHGWSQGQCLFDGQGGVAISLRHA